MIKHVLRQERSGGFWLVRDEGRAIELGPAAYAAMATACDTRSADGLASLWRDLAASEEAGILPTLERHGLTGPEAWAQLRHVPLDAPEDTLPVDAVVAPKRIYFEITRGCNLQCRSCFNNSHHRLSDELDLAEILDINRQAAELGVFEIRYTGGECTSVEGFRDVVADARERGLYVSIGTNGVYTDEQLQWLPSCGIDWFIISLDGDKETNDAVRGAGTYERVLQTLQVLSEHKHLRLRLNMVVAKHNMEVVERVAAVAAEHRVGSLNLIPLRPYGRSTKRMVDAMFTQQDFYGFIREINRVRRRFPDVTFSTTIDLLDPTATTSHDLMVQKKTTCAAGVEACVVGPQGHVYGCSYSPASFPATAPPEAHNLFIAGNLRQESLRTIWRDSRRWKVFRDLAQYKSPKCHSCSQYQVRCSGSCQIMAWYQLEHQKAVEAGEAALRDFYDPYCFVDLLGEQGKTADLAAPCGGAGMDGLG